MLMRKLSKTAALISIVLCLILSVSCGSKKTDDNGKQTDESRQSSTDTRPGESSEQTAGESGGATSDTASGNVSEFIDKINIATDGSGIYATVITMSDKIADKGEIEMVYYGAKGEAQENSVVNTYLIKYCKDGDGKFEINTFSDGKVDQNQHGKDVIKVNNTFGALVRADKIIITYTPDGGEPIEIYRATADQF